MPVHRRYRQGSSGWLKRVPCYPIRCSDICHEKREAPPFQPAVHIHSPPEPRHAPEPNSSPLSAARSDRKSTRLNSSHVASSYAVFCLKKKKNTHEGNAAELTNDHHMHADN